MNVLVVEDDPVDLKLMRSVLEADGHCVTAARSGEEALQAVARSRPQLIMTDLAMPRMDGVELARRLRASIDAASIPLIATTAYPGRFFLREARGAFGFFAMLVKPIDTERLPALLASLPAAQ